MLLLKEYIRRIISESLFEDNPEDRPKEIKYFHISQNDLGDEFTFTPRIPKNPYTDINGDVIEDTITKRTSWAPSIEKALEALGHQSLKKLRGSFFVYGVSDLPGLIDLEGEFDDCCDRLDYETQSKQTVNYGADWVKNDFIRATDTEQWQVAQDLENCVPDADATGEDWSTKPVSAKKIAEVYNDKIVWLTPENTFSESIVIERIRSNSFNLNVFKNLDRWSQMKYAADNLKYLGEGSARAVYLLSSQKVLKIAKNNKGIGQNEAELEIFTDPRTKVVIADIHDYDPDFKWLISDAVRTVKDRDFVKIFGLQPYRAKDFFEGIHDFSYDVQSMIENNCDSTATETQRKNVAEFIETLRHTIDTHDLALADIIMSHFGKTRDGRIVLYDYGYTSSVYEKYY